MVPLDLLATERATSYVEQRSSAGHRHIARAAREDSLRQLQARWDSSPKGRWTHRLIRNVHSWLNRKSGFVNFHLTQLLSGHGCFKSYLHRFGHEEDPLCSWCYPDAEETAEHVLFSCRRFATEKSELERAMGAHITEENLVRHMMEREESWSAVCTFAVRVTTKLRLLERGRCNEGVA